MAHVVRNRVEAAYARSDLFERRRILISLLRRADGREVHKDCARGGVHGRSTLGSLMDIAAMLRSYDGTRVAPFRAVAEAVRDTPERAVPRLLDLAASDEAALQVGATWVIK